MEATAGQSYIFKVPEKVYTAMDKSLPQIKPLSSELQKRSLIPLSDPATTQKVQKFPRGKNNISVTAKT